MAKSNRNNTAQSSSSGGLWETYEANIPPTLSEYKKPSCEDYIPGTQKKKSNNKRQKPAPALAALLFASGVEETAKNKKYTQPESVSGPNAWSMRSGSALFREPPPDERRRPQPYYPVAQADPMDEEELIRLAIEESIRTADEEKERMRRLQEEEDEWLSQVVKDLSKKENMSDMSEARKKVTRKYSDDSSNSDDFLNSAHGKSKSRASKANTTATKKGVSSLNSTEKKQNKTDVKSETKLKVRAEPSYVSSENNIREYHTRDRGSYNDKENGSNNGRDSSYHERNSNSYNEGGSNHGRDSSYSERNSHSYNEGGSNNGRGSSYNDRNSNSYNKRVSNNGRNSSYNERNSNSYNEGGNSHNGEKSRGAKVFSSNLYDDYDDGSEWEEADCQPPRSTTYWPSRNESHKWNAETWDGVRGKTSEPKAQRVRSLREELPDTRNYKHDSRRNKEDTRHEAIGKPGRSFKVDSQPFKSGSPAKSRNFKADFFDSQSEEIERELVEANKLVKFATTQNSGGPETDSSNAEVFASNKSKFDMSLYSTNYQKSKGLPINQSKQVKAYDSRNRERPSALNAAKSNVTRNSWKESLQTSDEKESKNSQSLNEEGNHKKPKRTDEPEMKDKKSSSLKTKPMSAQSNDYNSEDDLGPCLSDLKLDDLPLCVEAKAGELDTLKPVNVKTSVLNEIKAEVKLPQDNDIYNFYHNKQLGIQNSQEHLAPEQGFGIKEPTPPSDNLDDILENWYKKTKASVPAVTPSSLGNNPFSYPQPSTAASSGFTFPMLNVQSSYSQPPQVPYYTPQTVPTTLPTISSTELSTTPLPSALPVAPNYNMLPFPHMRSLPPPNAETRKSLELWQQLLTQAENDPVMLNNLNILLNRSIEASSNPEELNTLMSFVMEVDAAIKRYGEKHGIQAGSAGTGVQHTPAGVNAFVSDERAIGRGRGKRAEVKEFPANANPAPGVNPDPTDNTAPGCSTVTPTSAFHNFTGNTYLPPGTAYPNMTPGHPYPTPAYPSAMNTYPVHTYGSVNTVNGYPNPMPYPYPYQMSSQAFMNRFMMGQQFANPVPPQTFPNAPGQNVPDPTTQNLSYNPAP